MQYIILDIVNNTKIYQYNSNLVISNINIFLEN